MATNVFGPATISRASFAAVLKAANSPVLTERPADEYYSAIVGYGLDPAFMLAVFCHESNYATASGSVVLSYGTRNWGNTRSLSLTNIAPIPPFVDVPGKGKYVKFPNWLTGLWDACNRLVSPAYPYAKAGASTVETIIPIWAPKTDNNDPARYIAAVTALMAGWKDTNTVAITTFADVTKLLTVGDNRPGLLLNGFHACTVHETDNEAAGANALMHYGFINGAPRASKPSFHFCSDSAQVMQFLPVAPGIAEVGWHIGDGADEPYHDEAFYTVGGEICVNSRAGFPAACRNMARAFARVLFAHGKPVVDGVTVRTHGSYWSTENDQVHRGCPKHLKAGDWGVTWAGFIGMVQQEYAKLSTAAVPLAVFVQPTTGEADALKAFADTIPFFCRGNLLREGEADLAAFGGGSAERVCIYERLVTHRLKGTNNVLTLELLVGLVRGGLLRAYPDMPFGL